MFNDQILNTEYKRYLKSEIKHYQQNLDKVLNYMRLNENSNNTLGFVYSTIFLENAQKLKDTQNQINKIEEREQNNETNINAK